MPHISNKSKNRKFSRRICGVGAALLLACSWVFAADAPGGFALPGIPGGEVAAGGPAAFSDPITLTLPDGTQNTTVHIGFFDHPATTGTAFRQDQRSMNIGGLPVTTHDLFLLGNIHTQACMSLAPELSVFAQDAFNPFLGMLPSIMTAEEHTQFVALCPTYQQAVAVKPLDPVAFNAKFVKDHCPTPANAAECTAWGEKFFAICKLETVQSTLLDAGAPTITQTLCPPFQTLFATVQAVPQLCSQLLSPACNAAMGACMAWSSEVHACDSVKAQAPCNGSEICAEFLACHAAHAQAEKTKFTACLNQATNCAAFKSTCNALPNTLGSCLHLIDAAPGHIAACGELSTLPTDCQQPTFCAGKKVAEQAGCVLQCAQHVGPSGQFPIDRLSVADLRPKAGGNTVANAKELELTSKFPDVYAAFPIAPNARQAVVVPSADAPDGVAAILNRGVVGSLPNELLKLGDRQLLAYYRFTSTGGMQLLTPSVLGNGVAEPPLPDWTVAKCAPNTIQKDANGNFQPVPVNPITLQNSGCVYENDPVGIVAANLFGGPEPRKDLLVINRGKLPDGKSGFATLYRGQGFPASAQHFADLWRYAGFAPLWFEPYGTAVVRGANGKDEVWVAVNIPGIVGFLPVHIVFRIFVDDKEKLATQIVPLGVPDAQNQGPYQIAARELNGDGLTDFAVTFGRLSPGVPLFAPHVAVYLSQADGNYSVTKYQMPPITEDDQKQPTLARAAAVQFADVNRDGLTDLLVGDQRVFVQGTKRVVLMHILPGGLGGVFSAASAQSVKVNVRTDFLPHESTVGGVRQIAIDADQNVAVLNGLPLVHPNPVPITNAECLDTDLDGLSDTPSWLSDDELAQKDDKGNFVHESDWQLCAKDNCRPVHDECISPSIDIFGDPTNPFVVEFAKHLTCWNPVSVAGGNGATFNLQTDADNDGNGDIICEAFKAKCAIHDKKQELSGQFTAVKLAWIFTPPSENDPDHDYVPSFQLNPDGSFQFKPDGTLNLKCDNCPDVANQDQVDADFDGFGKACDSDDANFSVQ